MYNKFHYYSSPIHKMEAVWSWSPKVAHGPRCSYCKTMKTANENETDHYNVRSLFMNAVFCKESLRKNHASHTKNVDCF